MYIHTYIYIYVRSQKQPFFNTVNTYIQEQNKNCDIHTLKLH